MKILKIKLNNKQWLGMLDFCGNLVIPKKKENKICEFIATILAQGGLEQHDYYGADFYEWIEETVKKKFKLKVIESF